MALHYLTPELLDHQVSGHIPKRMGNRDPAMAPQGVYPCAGEDEWCAITVADDTQWTALVEIMGAPGWAADRSLATVDGRRAAHDAIDAGISDWTATRTAEEVERLFCEAGVPAGKVQRTRDLRADPQYLHREFYARLEHSEVGVVPYAGHQFRIRGHAHGPRHAAPCLGEHTYEVLTGDLGLSDDEVAAAVIAGAIA
jgi:benzylsuccinate CoA-transferase BbsF subunit